MLCWILAVTIPIYAGALLMSYQTTARRLAVDAERDADEVAGRVAAGLDAVIRPIEGGIRTVAYQLEEVDPPRTQYAQRIRGILGAWPDVYGSTIAVEAGSGDASGPPFAPYLFRRGDAVEFSDLARAGYGYRELAWYRRAADSERAVWSLPYFDAGGGETWMVTYSVAVLSKAPRRSPVARGCRHRGSRARLGDADGGARDARTDRDGLALVPADRPVLRGSGRRDGGSHRRLRSRAAPGRDSRGR
jgi:hypothetical protein